MTDFKTTEEIDAEIERLQELKQSIWPKTIPVSITLDQDIDALSELAEEYGLDIDAEKHMAMIKEEVIITFEVTEDGTVYVTAFENVKLEQKVQLN